VIWSLGGKKVGGDINRSHKQ